jgi:hypothetical protein
MVVLVPSLLLAILLVAFLDCSAGLPLVLVGGASLTRF